MEFRAPDETNKPVDPKPPVTTNPKCKDPRDTTNWPPAGCKIWMANSCDQYEISKDGKDIISCNTPEMCAAVYLPPRCTVFYDGATT